MRNPRRAYDEHGNELKPATVASHLAQGLRLIEIWCNECHHHRDGIDVSDLPPDTPIPDICLSFRCSQCGSKDLTSRGDTHEFYAQQRDMRLRRGWGSAREA